MNPFSRSKREPVDVKVTYLQALEAAADPGTAPPGVTVMRASCPTVSFYRYLYHAVGSRWMWFERRRLSDDELVEVIADPSVEINVIYLDGVPAGYCELDRRESGETELAYFGLIHEFIGRGLGSYFIRWTLHRAWQGDVSRVWLHTCSMDHPRAVGVYQAAGLVPYRQEQVRIADPRDSFEDLG
jgi:GNAT superfamily N-acetyltransferase